MKGVIYILTIYKEYQKEVILPLVKENPDVDYSDIFNVARSDQSNSSNKTIMIVGQNAMNKEKFNSESLLKQFNNSKQYLEKQLYGVTNEYKKNPSPFWRFLKKLKDSNYEIIWNNIDKINRVEDGNAKDATYEDELIINSPYGVEYQTLLEREIEFYSPDIILFLTGPSYSRSMATALQLDSEKLDELKPNPTTSIVDISSKVNSNVKMIWTYHPNYLSRSSNFDEVLENIIKTKL